MHKPFSFFALATLLLVPVIFFITCKKEYSYEGGPVGGSVTGTAVFTFSGAGGACTSAIISGNYYTGIALNVSNTVELDVNVTTAGTYTVNISDRNGISFTASGNFTNTGIQSLLLNGNGSPVSAGNTTFFTPVNPACSFVIAVDPAPVAIADFTFAGAQGACSPTVVMGDYFSGTALTNLNSVTIGVNVTSPGVYTIKTDTINGISFSASGTFTSTGATTVVLKGSGTPDIARNITFIPHATSQGCTFTIEVLPPGQLATYVLESGSGNPNPCIYTIAGTYVAGLPLSAANTITMRTFVTATGNFAIATDVVNGMLFAYTGNFTATGSQFVTLQGIGTPIAAGPYALTPQIVGPHPLGGQACGITITVN